MNRLLSLVLVFAMTSFAAFGAGAQTLQPPDVGAKSFLVIDVTSNQVLAERNADEATDPASLTKLMTAYVVFQALRDKKISLEQTLPVSVRAWNERKGGGSLMFIDPKMTPTVNDLLRGMIAVSANDAAVALAEGVSGSVGAFVDAMNRQATAFGLKNTSFKNVTGVTEAGHRSTARDVAYIAARIVKDFPEYYPYYSIKEFRFNNITQPNRNLLLRRDPTVDGMKTGYTEAAGYCFIASAQRDMPNGKRRLLAVVMNTTSTAARANEAQKLLNWGYQAFDTVRLFDADKVIDNPPVWKGRSSTVQLGAAGAVYATVPRGEGDKLVTRFERTDPLVAPLAKGQRVGTLKVSTAAGTPVSEVPLLVLQPVEEAGVFGRAWDGLRLWIK